jgi:hypothetical protein
MAAPFAQKNFLQIIGRNNPDGRSDHQPRYRIDETGCLLVSDTNLAQRFGKSVDPLWLNAFFREHLVYIDVDDGILDDLSWWSISQAYPDIVVSRAVMGKTVADRSVGWPKNKDSIIRVYYQSISRPWLDAAKTKANMITHFVLCVDPGQKLILDAWDGQIKKNPYGEPTGFAEYELRQAANVIPYSPPVTSVSTLRKLHLPASVPRWRVYPLNKPPVVGNEVGFLLPQQFGGLTYDILAEPVHNIVFTIQTEAFGRVNIFGDPNKTDAQIIQSQPVAAPPAPAPAAAAPSPAPQPAAPVPQVEVTSTTTAPAEETITPEQRWEDSFVETPGEYVSLKPYTVKDLKGLQSDLALAANKKFPVVGFFDYADGKRYARYFSKYLTDEENEQSFYAIPLSQEDGIIKAVTPMVDPEEDKAIDSKMDKWQKELFEFAEKKNIGLKKRLFAIVSAALNALLHKKQTPGK